MFSKNSLVPIAPDVIPEHLKPEVAREELLVPDFSVSPDVATYLATLRHAAKQQKKVRFDYIRQDGAHSSRCVHPLGLVYWGKVWTRMAWCELRNTFGHFRLDRIQSIDMLEQRFEVVPGRTPQDFLNTECDNS
ncbi:MAG: WYL domain-containing protein [Thiobacillus sp.]|nr:WYL domain-containing protein [Thiobacillus sp.]